MLLQYPFVDFPSCLFPCVLSPITFYLPEHSEPQQPKLLLRAGAECELPGPLHEDGDRHSAAKQRHQHPAAESETGKAETDITFQ